MKDSHYSLISRLLFAAASLLLLVALIEWIIEWFGYRLASMPYQPGRLLEFAAILVIFVIALLLRQIRDTLRNK